MSKESTELKSSGNAEFDRLAEMAVAAGLRVFPRTRQIVAADNGSSGSAETSLAAFERIVRKRAEEAFLDELILKLEQEGAADDGDVTLRQQIGRILRKPVNESAPD